MNAFGLLIVSTCLLLPIAWIASEYQDRRWPRLVLGSTSILLSFGVAALVGSLERLNDNIWYGEASVALIDATIAELEAGHGDEVLRSLKGLRRKYSPTYENRANYDGLIDETVSQMRAASRKSQ